MGRGRTGTLISKLRGKGHVVAVSFGCLLLVSYLFYLIFLNYRAQVALRDSALSGFRVDLEKKAVSLGYFFSERKYDLRRLADSREVFAYFANRSMGMSEAYGLKVNAFVTETLLKKTMAAKRMDAKPIYDRMVLADRDRRAIADTGGGAPPEEAVLWEVLRELDDAQNPQVKVVEVGAPLRMVCVTACVYRGRVEGWLLAWIHFDTVHDSLLHVSGDLPEKEIHLLGRNGHVLDPTVNVRPGGWLKLSGAPLGEVETGGFVLHELTDHTGARLRRLTLQVPVQGTEMKILGLVAPEGGRGQLTPLQLFASMAVLAGLIVAGLSILFRSTAQNLILKGRFEESERQQALLAEKNAQLKNEIDRRKTAEEERERYLRKVHDNQKLEAIGTLAGGIAHDFNNVLGAIVGYTELAKYSLSSKDGARQHLERVLTASERAQGLVRQILTFSRKAGHSRALVAPGELVSEVFGLLEGSIPKTVELRKTITAGVGCVYMDPNQFHQILVNLCTNGYQALADGHGVIEVTLAACELDADAANRLGDVQPGPFVRLTVSDTGRGIPQEVVPRIFEPFFTTKRVGEGSGMGLAVVHGIVRSAGGAIEVDSVVGSGTRVSVYLPRQDGRSQSIRRSDEVAVTGTERILFVDDEPVLAELAAETLGQMGYDVVSEVSSVEALRKFREAPDSFSVVVTDQTMPGLTGEQLAGEILSCRPGTPIILCTGYSETMDQRRAAQVGIRAFMLKPVRGHELSRKIREVLQSG